MQSFSRKLTCCWIHLCASFTKSSCLWKALSGFCVSNVGGSKCAYMHICKCAHVCMHVNNMPRKSESERHYEANRVATRCWSRSPPEETHSFLVGRIRRRQVCVMIIEKAGEENQLSWSWTSGKRKSAALSTCLAFYYAVHAWTAFSSKRKKLSPPRHRANDRAALSFVIINQVNVFYDKLFNLI